MASVLLDTNVLSELMRPRPDPVVMDWFAARSRTLFYVSAVTQAEIRLGIALLPAGRRREALAAAAAAIFAEEFAGRSLAFDDAAATRFAELVAASRAGGRTMSTEDAQIAAIALAHGHPLATRNTRDFAHIEGLTLYDPWAA
jgi:predicted nucleic acid-binding protein